MKLDLHSLPLVYRSALLRLEFSQKDALSALASSAVVVADLRPSRPVVLYYGDALPNVDSLADKSALHLVVLDTEGKPSKHAKGVCPACFSLLRGSVCLSCPAPAAMGWGGAYAQPVPSPASDEVTIPPDVFARVKDVVFLNGRDDTNDGLSNHLHRVASEAVRDALADEDIDPDAVDASQLEELAIEYKGGFWDLCHQEERARGKAALAFLAELLECGSLDPLEDENPSMHAGISAMVAGAAYPMDNAIKALGVLGRLHDGLSDMVEGGRLSEATIPDDYQWLVSMLTNESLPLFPEGTRGNGAAVPAPAKSECIHCPNCGVLAGVSRVVQAPDLSAHCHTADDEAALAHAQSWPKDGLPRMDLDDAPARAESFALAALRRVLPFLPGYAEKDTAGRPWLANALAVAGGEHPETPAEMIERVFSKANEETETWRGPDYIGSDLAYLAWAIAEGPGRGAVEWDQYNAAFVRFHEWFPASDPVWQFIKHA